MPHLKFHPDGAITVTSHGVPDASLGAPGQESLLHHLRSGVSFEPGLTVRVLMRSLEPWFDVISDMGWLDCHAWSRALSRAHLADAATVRPANDEEPDVLALVVKPTIYVDEGKAGPSVMVEWELRGWFRPDDPRKPAGDDYCAVDLSFVREWAMLPLSIETEATIIDRRRRKTPWLAAPTLEVDPTLFDTIILGILDEMSTCGSPEDMEAMTKQINAVTAALDEAID